MVAAKLVNGTVAEKYLWSGLTTLLAVYDGSDNLLQRFEYADGRMPVSMTAGGSTYYLAYDQVGSPRLVTDSFGAIIKRIDYDTFGNIISDSNPAFTIPFGFAGGLHDRDTGLVRFGFRDYMPEIGRWTAKDPILFAAGDANLYGYVGNDPVNFVDFWGLDPSFSDLKSGYQDKGPLMKKMDWSKKDAWISEKIEAGGSCGARLSNAHNNTGSEFTKNATVRKFTDNNGNTYILGAAEVAKALSIDSQKYRIKSLAEIQGKTGYIYYENKHIDLWDGKQMRGNRSDDYNVPKYFKELK